MFDEAATPFIPPTVWLNHSTDCENQHTQQGNLLEDMTISVSLPGAIRATKQPLLDRYPHAGEQGIASGCALAMTLQKSVAARLTAASQRL